MDATSTLAQLLARRVAHRHSGTPAIAVPVDRVITAAAYIAREWGEHGYSIAVESALPGATLFRGHSTDGSDFYFVVDRHCNVADVKES